MLWLLLLSPESQTWPLLLSFMFLSLLVLAMLMLLRLLLVVLLCCPGPLLSLLHPCLCPISFFFPSFCCCFQPPSRIEAFFLGTSGAGKKKKKKPDISIAINKAVDDEDDGAKNITVDLTKEKKVTAASEVVRLRLHFRDKWMLLSEVDFKTGKPDATVVQKVMTETPTPDTAEAGKGGDAEEMLVEKQDAEEEVEVEVQTTMADTPADDDEEGEFVGSNEYNGRAMTSDGIDPGTETSSSDSHQQQIFVGLVIGALGVTVLLLATTILVMLKRNRSSSRKSAFEKRMAGTESAQMFLAPTTTTNSTYTLGGNCHQAVMDGHNGKIIYEVKKHF